MPPRELRNFLSSGPDPVFVGFGSMIIPSPARVVAALVGAARATGVRLLLQSGYADWESELDAFFKAEEEAAGESGYIPAKVRCMPIPDGCR